MMKHQRFNIINNNKIIVTTSNSLSTYNVKIEFGIGVNSKTNDNFLLKNKQIYSVLYNGVLNHVMENEYGENDFLVTYDDEFYFSFRQFKTNRNNEHEYYFHFLEKDGIIFCLVNITGINHMCIEVPLKKYNFHFVSSSYFILI